MFKNSYAQDLHFDGYTDKRNKLLRVQLTLFHRTLK